MIPRMTTQNKCVFENIRLCAQNTITNIDSIVNMIRGGRGLYEHLMSTRILTLRMIRWKSEKWWMTSVGALD